MPLIFLINLVISFIATGLISTIQLVHYPSMKFIPKDKFKDFHTFHSQKISILAVPIMVIELVTSFLLFYRNTNNAYNDFVLINFIIIILIWASTFLLQVPIHNTLSMNKNEKLLDRLILTNWIRTILWTLRSILMVCFLGLLSI